MVARTFFAIDNDNLVVTSSSSAAIVGNGIINNSSTPDGTIFQYSSGAGQVIELDDTGGDPDTFEDDNAAGHTILDGGGLVATGQSVESESIIEVRALDINGVAVGPVISISVFSQGGSFSNVWGFSSDAPLVDGTSYVKTNGSNAGSSDYIDFVACFVKGTQIDTPSGPRAIETLRPGDLVQTRDNAAQPVRWIGHRSILGRGKFAPVRFAAGVLGNSKSFSVSPEHKVLVDNPHVQLAFGVSSALVAAKHLVGLRGITQKFVPEVTYYHVLFDGHEIIKSYGCWSESFFLSENAISGLETGAREEIRTLFPDMPVAKKSFGSAAAMTLKSYEAELLKSYMLEDENELLALANSA